jgi:hypothetical protein
MKKAGWLLVLMFSATMNLSAQTFDEWFRQNSTQLKYLEVQIAALQAYSVVLRAGYRIAAEGLGGIGSIELADTTIHANYFSSLELVSPAVRGDPRVAEVLAYCKDVPVLADRIAALGLELGATVAENLRAACDEDLAWLNEVLTDGDLELTDSDRLRLIGTLYSNAKGRYAFSVDLFWELKGIKKIQ